MMPGPASDCIPDLPYMPDHGEFSPPSRLFGQRASLTHYICHWSRTRRYVYVETPKVATTTIKRTLQAAELGPGRQHELPDEVHEFTRSPLNAAASDHQGFVAAMRDPDHFRFGFVRNPFTRALSCWRDKMVGNEFERWRLAPQLGLDPTEPPALHEFLCAVARQPEDERDPHWASQAYLLRPGRIDYDFIGRFEAFGTDFPKLCRRLNIAEFASDPSLKTNTTDAAARLASDLGPGEAALIRHIYEEDFRTFGYGWGIDPI